MVIPFAGGRDPSVIGHELSHVSELLGNPIPVEELAKLEGFWPSSGGGFESAAAIAAEELISAELSGFSGDHQFTITWSCERGKCQVTDIKHVDEILPPLTPSE